MRWVQFTVGVECVDSLKHFMLPEVCCFIFLELNVQTIYFRFCRIKFKI